MGKVISDPDGSGVYWTLPVSGFANPRYITGLADKTDAKGFAIADAGMVLVSYENGATATIVHEQTFDATGVGGWFPVLGKALGSGAAVPGATAYGNGQGFVFPAHGVRHRMRVTALTVADLRARIALSDLPFDLVGGGLATSEGKQVVRLNADAAQEWAFAIAAAVTTAVSSTVKAAAGAGIKNYLTSMQLTNSGATGTEVRLKSSAGGTVIWRDFMPPGAKSNVNLTDPLASNANAVLELEVVTAGAAIWANAQGYTGP